MHFFIILLGFLFIFHKGFADDKKNEMPKEDPILKETLLSVVLPRIQITLLEEERPIAYLGLRVVLEASKEEQRPFIKNKTEVFTHHILLALQRYVNLYWQGKTPPNRDIIKGLIKNQALKILPNHIADVKIAEAYFVPVNEKAA